MKKVLLIILGLIVSCIAIVAFGDEIKGMKNIGDVATTAKGSLAPIAAFATAASYVAGMLFAIGAIAKFKAHKDNPTQVPISMPIVFLFVAGALIFAPMVFRSVGGTLYGESGIAGGVSGITSFKSATGDST